jgi:hypothetical protein
MAFGIDDAIAVGSTIINKYIPDPAEKAKAAAEFESQVTARRNAQLAVDTAEIQSGSLLGKWRGALGWGLAGSAIYQFMLHPFLVAIILWINADIPGREAAKARLGATRLGAIGDARPWQLTLKRYAPCFAPKSPSTRTLSMRLGNSGCPVTISGESCAVIQHRGCYCLNGLD